MSKRICFEVESHTLRLALEEYAATKGLKLHDLARLALFEHVRRRWPVDESLAERLCKIR